MTKRENEWFIQVPWGRICVLAWGNSLDPPVLLCHGNLDSAASFRPLVQHLPNKFYYIGMEFPGCGRSDRFPAGLMVSAYDLVYSVDAVAQHFRWNNFAFIGHSMGAYIGKLFNVSCPGRLSKFIELDPINLIGILPDQFSLWYHRFFTSFYDNMDKYNTPKERSPKLSWNKAVERMKKARGLSSEDAAATLKRFTEPVGPGLIRYTFDLRMKLIHPPAFTPEHIRAIFTSLPTPTLNIISIQSYEKGLYRNTDFLLDESIYPAKNYRCIKVDGSHDVHIIKPALVAGYVAQFLVHGLESSKAKL